MFRSWTTASQGNALWGCPKTVQLFNNASGQGTPLHQVSLGRLESIHINGHGGDDRLIVDVAEGAPFPGGRLTFDGGSQGVGGDVLEVRGCYWGKGSYRPALDGTAAFIAWRKTMNLVGLEGVTTSGFRALEVLTAGGEDVISLDAPAAGQGRVSGSSDGVAFAPIAFTDTDNLIVDAAYSESSGAGDDAITIGGGVGKAGQPVGWAYSPTAHRWGTDGIDFADAAVDSFCRGVSNGREARGVVHPAWRGMRKHLFLLFSGSSGSGGRTHPMGAKGSANERQTYWGQGLRWRLAGVVQARGEGAGRIERAEEWVPSVSRWGGRGLVLAGDRRQWRWDRDGRVRALRQGPDGMPGRPGGIRAGSGARERGIEAGQFREGAAGSEAYRKEAVGEYAHYVTDPKEHPS